VRHNNVFINPLPDILFLWRLLSAHASIKLTISPVVSGFQPSNFIQLPLQSSFTHDHDSNYTHPFVSLLWEFDFEK